MKQITERAGTLCLTAANLIVSSELLRLAVGLAFGQRSSTTVAQSLTYGFALAGMVALLLALTAVYVGHQRTLGALGLVGYVMAAAGTVLVAGDWWFEAFAVPMIATHAPDVLELPPGGSVLAGALVTVGLFTAGWITFGVAALRSAAFGRPAGVLLVIGGVCGVLALSTPYQMPLAVAVGFIGTRLLRTPTNPAVLPQPFTALPDWSTP